MQTRSAPLTGSSLSDTGSPEHRRTGGAAGLVIAHAAISGVAVSQAIIFPQPVTLIVGVLVTIAQLPAIIDALAVFRQASGTAPHVPHSSDLALARRAPVADVAAFGGIAVSILGNLVAETGLAGRIVLSVTMAAVPLRFVFATWALSPTRRSSVSSGGAALEPTTGALRQEAGRTVLVLRLVGAFVVVHGHGKVLVDGQV